ncbi:Binding partner of ACD11 1 [Linum grandiflorum]
MTKIQEAGDGEKMVLDTKDFTWRIPNFSKLKEEIYSDAFVVGGHRWRILCFPKGNDVDSLSLYLDFADWEIMPADGWTKYADFNITLVNQINPSRSRKFCAKHVFKEEEEDWGFTSFITLAELHNRRKGFIVDDTLLVKARVATELGVSKAVAAADPENVIEPDPENRSNGDSTSPPLSTKNLITELSTIASIWGSTSSIDEVIVSTTNDANHDGSSDIPQQEKEKLMEFLDMSLEAICQANRFDNVQQLVVKMAEHATNPFQKSVLKGLLSRVVEFTNTIPRSLSVIESSHEVETCSAQATKELERSLVQRQKQLAFLESEVSRIEEEVMRVEAEMQLLGALKQKLLQEKSLTVTEMEMANKEASRELGELKSKHREHKQAKENRLRAKERLAQSNASWKLFKDNLGMLVMIVTISTLSSRFEFVNHLQCSNMYPGGYIVEVSSLSHKATENDVRDFFAHCGAIEHIEIMRSGEYACTAYVTFRDAYSIETAVLLSGATIVDQRVCISVWGTNIDECDPWNTPSWKLEGRAGYEEIHVNHLASSPGEAVTVAQEVVKTMLAKGYILGKDALVKAKALDESHKVSASAAAKVAELSTRIGLTESIQSGMETAKFIDEKYHVSDITKTAVLYTGAAAVTAATITGRSAAAAAHAVVNSSYFAKGAVWVSDVLTRAAHASAEFGHKTLNK